MTDKRDPKSGRDRDDARANRLAAALRANLRRRKLQERRRSEADRQRPAGEKTNSGRDPADR